MNNATIESYLDIVRKFSLKYVDSDESELHSIVESIKLVLDTLRDLYGTAKKEG